MPIVVLSGAGDSIFFVRKRVAPVFSPHFRSGRSTAEDKAVQKEEEKEARLRYSRIDDSQWSVSAENRIRQHADCTYH